MRNDDPHRYDDLLDLPHPVSATLPHMSIYDRAAQFAPFAALSGYHAAIDETGRFRDTFDWPDELRQAQLNETLALLCAAVHTHPTVQITCFVSEQDDADSGTWRTVTDTVTDVDAEKQLLTCADGTQIRFAQILEIRYSPEI